jgi:limonene-1,2-epoxide hydrolase
MDPTNRPASEVVDDFIAALVRGDLRNALGMVTDDVEYDNVPLEPVYGPDGIRDLFARMLPDVDELDWVVHRQVASGDTVFNERTDRFRKGDKWFEIEVAGVFVVRGGRIALWRDYFDMDALRRGLADLGKLGAGRH